jgi:hypothetical protein
MALERVKRGDPISHEWANALVDAINALQITVSPPLQITKSARGGLVLSIAYGFDLTCVCELLEDLAAGGDAEAKILWDKDQAGTWATDADTETIQVYAPTDMEGVTGDRVLAKFDRQSGLWLAWQKDC